METLLQAATPLITTQGWQAVYDQLLDTSLGILHADFATIQMLHPERGGGELRLLGHRGLSVVAAERWEWISRARRTTCGEALRTGKRVVVPDVQNSALLAASEELDALLKAGIRAIQSTPLVSRSGAVVGMVSTHWRGPHEPSPDELRRLDILARLATDLIERSRADDERRKALEQLQLITDNMSAGVSLCSRDLRYVWVSPALGAMMERSPAEMIGRQIIDILGREAMERIQPHVEKVLSGQRVEYEARVNYLKTGIRWIHAVYVPTTDRDGQVDAWIAVVTDITERREAEEAARASEARLREAQNLAKVGSWERNLDTGRDYWSDEVRQIFGVKNDAPLDFAFFATCIHPKDRARVMEDERRVRSTPGPVETEFRIIRPDGQVRFVRSITEAIRNERGEPVRITGATQDVTEQVGARELLRESADRLKNSERLAQIGHWTWDFKTGHVTWSDAMYRVLGQPRDFAPSFEGFLQAVAPQDRERVRQTIQQRIGGRVGNPGYQLEFQIERPDGEVRTIRSISEVQRDEESQATHAFGAIQDITDLRLAQEENLARQKLESVGTLANGIAHDFNNLLGGVLAQAELALTELAEGAAPQEEIKRIRDVAISGSEIVRQLMIYAGKESVVSGPVDVSRVVKEMLELLKVSVSKRAAIESDLAQDLPAIQANAAQIQQIVMNLVTNASEAIGERDGAIRVTTKLMKAAGAPSGASSDQAASFVQLEVSDTGAGMTPETRARVFDPFFTTKSAGHGLGLAVVQGIVRSLRGTIHLDSEPGTGSRFQVLLPCAETKAGANDDAVTGFRPPAAPSIVATVLVVEDEDSLRQAVVKVLRKSGFEVLEAADGSAAIDVLRKKGREIDLVLLDMTMGGASSREIVAEVAKTRPDTKVILPVPSARRWLQTVSPNRRFAVLFASRFKLRISCKWCGTPYPQPRVDDQSRARPVNNSPDCPR
jgi:PAS domain S-box-containing protein